MTTTLIGADDPQACPDCIAAGQVCAFHRGYERGWDDAAEVVGRFVVLVPKGDGR